MFKKRESEELHRIAVQRLQRALRAKAEYFRTRIDHQLGEAFDEWGTDVSEADRAPATKVRRSPSATVE